MPEVKAAYTHIHITKFGEPPAREVPDTPTSDNESSDANNESVEQDDEGDEEEDGEDDEEGDEGNDDDDNSQIDDNIVPPPQLATRPSDQGGVGLVYDARMGLHKEDGHPEQPARISEIFRLVCLFFMFFNHQRHRHPILLSSAGGWRSVVLRVNVNG